MKFSQEQYACDEKGGPSLFLSFELQSARHSWGHGDRSRALNRWYVTIPISPFMHTTRGKPVQDSNSRINIESAFDTAHPYYDPKSTREAPKWEVVHVEFRKKFKDLVKLTELKSFGKPGGALENLQMLKQGRLSVSAVTGKQWKFIMGLTEEDSDT